VELHLDDSVDAKALLGTYVCGDRPGEFAWQPGPMAVAMAQGDWVLIEDLDKCPRELLAALRPVLEGQPLAVGPHRPPLVAAAGFKLFGTCTVATATATATLNEDANAPLFSPSGSAAGVAQQAPRPPAKPLAPNALFGLSRLFLQVAIAPLHAPSGEVAAVARALFPALPDALLAPTLRSFDAVASLTAGGGGGGSSLRAFAGPSGGAARVPTVRDLLKVCRRLAEGPFKHPAATFKLTSGAAARVVAEVVDVAVVGSADEACMAAAARALGAVWQLHPESIVARCASHTPDFRHEALPPQAYSELGAAAEAAGGEAAPAAVVVVGRVRMPAQALPLSRGGGQRQGGDEGRRQA
jgi:hypothetical protein